MTMTINNEHKKLNVPNLRFKEFQGEWKESTIGEMFDLYSGNTPSRLNKEHFKGTVNWISSGELKEHYIYSSKEQISEEAAKSLKLLPVGTFVIAIYGLEADGVRGTGSITQEPSTISQACMSFIPKGVIENEFLYSWYKKHGNVIGIRYAQGTKQQNLSYDILEKFRIAYPNTKEQEKLNKFISLLDERIATQNKIIDKLQSLIKGLEDNLLDNPLWEKTYLRSFMQFFPTNSLSWEQLGYKEGAIRNLHYGLIHSFQTRGINSASLPMIKNEAVPKQYVLCQVGDVAFADASEDTGEIAKSVEFVDTIEGDTICGLHTIHGRDIKNRTVVGFKGFAFNSRYFHNQIKRLAQGTKVFSITANNLSSCYVYLPDLEKQKAIVKLLRSYEEQLIIGRMILKQYEKQKQYLLRQMFI
ncbi:restriction endonuclease subunit S [Prevotella merdae]|uniref:restriction endonuclease subunit S n=1 Tax=Prevotella merdae TaxID=2079531 RepID=UPI000D112D83|nr:restriction endonuclease subunit S [Prevotella merdae]